MRGGDTGGTSNLPDLRNRRCETRASHEERRRSTAGRRFDG
nr:MAG TPA: hypothetical protein [Caudoviricetes sp.]